MIEKHLHTIILQCTVLRRLNAFPPPPKGGVYLKYSFISREKNVYTLFELLDEDIVEAALSFNLIDEENDDDELEIL